MYRVNYDCPKCGSPDVYRSRRRSILDRFLSFFGFYPYICEEANCRKRFYRASRGHGRPPTNEVTTTDEVTKSN